MPQLSAYVQAGRLMRNSAYARELTDRPRTFSPQGPHPCASTNSATGARGGQYSPELCPSTGRGTVSNTCSPCGSKTNADKEPPHGSDQETAGDLRVHQALFGDQRVSTDRAGYRQGGRPRVVVDGSCSSRQPGEDWAVAT